MEATLKYAEHKLDEAIKQGEPDETIAYWRGYRDCAKALQQTCNKVATGCKPLTPEQLRGMDGKPAYWMEDDSWGIISVDSAGPWAGKPFFRGRKFEVNFEYDIESRGMEVYAYPPAHIDREAWEPCGCCKSCDTCLHDTYSEKDRALCSLCHKHEYYEPKFNYCHICGRPLKEKAWAELEKRMRG